MDTSILILALPLVFLLVTPALAQETMPGPTMDQCGPKLLAMAPCAPFVQGQEPSPSLPCCDNLKRVYSDQPGCLCLFLNGTALAALPINTTLALQLPGLCSPQIDPSSTCSPSSSSDDGGVSKPSPGSQAAVKTPSTSTTGTAASPVDTAPTPSSVGFGMGMGMARNLAYNLRTSHLGVAAVAVMILIVN